ncbi:MAG: LdpA C-terminal domain-containing domain, partial [Cyanobium sp.]
DAVELHTRIGRAGAFAARLNQLVAAAVSLHRVAVSCGLEAAAGPIAQPGRIEPRVLIAELWQRHAQLRQAGLRPLWQLDGRPMSGDVGAGTARSAVNLLQAVAAKAPPGPLQLAGGTNDRTLDLVEGLDPGLRRTVAGVAFGSVARSRLQPLLLQAQARGGRLLDQRDLLPRALASATELVEGWLRRG